MLSEPHIKRLASGVTDGKDLSKQSLSKLDTDADLEGHENTTHFVIVDKHGMMVSVTNTLSDAFGSGEYVGGFFLNNQLKNFSNQKNSPNCPEPGKRPFSYTTPTILAKDGRPVIGIGAAGGHKITSMVSQQLVDIIKFNKPVQDSVEQPRLFLALNENKMYVEGGYTFLEDPQKYGIDVEYLDKKSDFGSVQGLVVDYKNRKIHGASDPRRDGSWDTK